MRKWDDNIKMDLKEIGCVNNIKLVQVSDVCRALVNVLVVPCVS